MINQTKLSALVAPLLHHVDEAHRLYRARGRRRLEMARPVLDITELAKNALHGEEQSRSDTDQSELEPAVDQRCDDCYRITEEGLPRDERCERVYRVQEAQCLEGVEHRHVGSGGDEDVGGSLL